MQVIFWKLDICLFDSTSKQKTQFLIWAHKALKRKTIHSLFSVWRKNFIILQITESFLSVSVSISCYQYWWGCDGICMMIPHHLINVAQYGSTATTLPNLNCLSDTYYILHIYCALMRQKHRQLWHNLVYLAEPRRIDKKMKIKANKKSTYYINYDNDYVSRHININKKWLSPILERQWSSLSVHMMVDIR